VRAESPLKPEEYYKQKYDEERHKTELLEKKLALLLQGINPDLPRVSPKHATRGSPRKRRGGRRRAKSSDLDADKNENAIEEQNRPKLKILSTRRENGGVSIAQRFALGPDDSGGFRGFGRGRGIPPSTSLIPPSTSLIPPSTSLIPPGFHLVPAGGSGQ